MGRSTGKRLRFQIFERDGYACRYCGAQPPDVVLVVDHVLPVKADGETTEDNLVTACEACNQGKAARVLGEFPPAPDNEIRYLQVQQEIGEAKRYLDALTERENLLNETVAFLQGIWAAESGLDWVPAQSIIRQAIQRYAPEVVERAVRTTAHKAGDGVVKRGEWWRYFWAVARNMSEQGDTASETDASSGGVDYWRGGFIWREDR